MNRRKFFASLATAIGIAKFAPKTFDWYRDPLPVTGTPVVIGTFVQRRHEYNLIQAIALRSALPGDTIPVDLPGFGMTNVIAGGKIYAGDFLTAGDRGLMYSVCERLAES